MIASAVSSLVQALGVDRESLKESCAAVLAVAGIGAEVPPWPALFEQLLTALSEWCGTQTSSQPPNLEAHCQQDSPGLLGQVLADQAQADGLFFSQFMVLLKDLRQVFNLWAIGNRANAEDRAQTILLFGRFFDRLEFGGLTRRNRNNTIQLKRALLTAKQTLLYEKKRYLTIFQKISEPAFVVDASLRLVDANPACARFFGKEIAELTGRSCCEVIGQRVCNVCALERALADQTSFSHVETIIVVRGLERNVMLSGTFLGSVSQEAPVGLVIIQDLTEKKRYERALLESEDKYRTLIENVPEVTWRVDPHGHILYISPNVLKLTGYTAGEITTFGPAGRAARIHPQDSERVRRAFALLFAENRPFDLKYRFCRKDGEWIWLHDRAGAVYERDGRWMADGVVSDVTELQKAHEELLEYREWLEDLVDERTEELHLSNVRLRQEIAERQKAEEELMKLAANLKRSNVELEQFAHVASHDLKEPLLVIVAFGERLLHRFGEIIPESGREYLQRMLKSARKMQQLVDGLLQLSRVTMAGRPFEIIDLNDLVREVIEDLEESIRQAHGHVEIGALPSLSGDRMQIRQLLQNIITNSLKYRKEMVDPLIFVRGSVIGENMCEIVIEDNGIGFDEKYLSRIFNPFVRLGARSDSEGTGIGLTTCRKIVMRHGGEITARSAPDCGATFIIRLPIRHTEECPATPAYTAEPFGPSQASREGDRNEAADEPGRGDH